MAAALFHLLVEEGGLVLADVAAHLRWVQPGNAAELARQPYEFGQLLGVVGGELVHPFLAKRPIGLMLVTALGPGLSWEGLGNLLANLVLVSATYGLLFYLNWRVLVPHLLGRHRLGMYCLAAWLATCAAVLLRLLAAWWPHVGPGDWHTRAHPGVAGLQAFGAGVAVVFISFAIRLTSDYLRVERRRNELERQQLLMELALLKAQLQPHFLFNTLNNIYMLTTQHSAQAPEAVMRLAELMRYVLYESGTDTVPLSREVTHLHSFLELQRLRLNGDADEAIRFHVSGDTQGHALPPMLLMPLVENAFKHGDLAADAPAVRVQLRAAEESLHFAVYNRVDAEAGRGLPQSGGLGLATLRRRLDLAYPNRYDLHVAASPSDYEITLTLWPERAA
jgi:hypothetical protein